MTLKTVSSIVFASRWLQLPLYLGLILVQVVYIYYFFHEFWKVGSIAFIMGEQPGEHKVMMGVLKLIDVVMISNLLIMVIVGGYETFVSKIYMKSHPDRPDWLSKVNASVLKIKVATGIVTISSVHLLQTFIESPHMKFELVMAQAILHVVFLLSVIALAYTERLLRVNK